MAPSITERKNNLKRRIGILTSIITTPHTPKGEVEACTEMVSRLEGLLGELGSEYSETGTWYGYRLPERWYGSKCNRNNYVPLTEINKLIRAEIKTLRALGKKVAKQAGTEVALFGSDALGAITDMPDFIKVSVRKGSGGGSIYITLKDVPADWWEDATDTYGHPYRKPVKKFQDLINALYNLMDQYRYDGSDAQVDYFDTNFYEHVEAVDAGRPEWPYATRVNRSRW